MNIMPEYLPALFFFIAAALSVREHLRFFKRGCKPVGKHSDLLCRSLAQFNGLRYR